MGYVDENLMEGEMVAHRTRLHWILFVGPAFWAGLMLLLAFLTRQLHVRASDVVEFLSETLEIEGLGDSPVVWSWAMRPTLFMLLLAAMFGLQLAVRFMLFKTSEFAVTNKRVLIKVGALRRRTTEILLTKVEALGVDQPILGRLLDYGSLTVGGTGGTQEVFHRIVGPMKFRRKVQEVTPA